MQYVKKTNCEKINFIRIFMFLIYFLILFNTNYRDWIRHNNISEHFHQSILDGTAVPNYPQRLLIPYSIEAVFQFSKTAGLENLFSIERLYRFFEFFFFFLTIILFHNFLLNWFSEKDAFINNLILIILILVTMQQDAAFSDAPNLFVFMLAIIFIHKQKLFYLLLLVFIGTLNREVVLFIPLMYFFANKEKNLFLRLNRSFCLFIFWLLPFLLLRLNKTYEIAAAHFKNVSNLFDFSSYVVFFSSFNLFWFYFIFAMFSKKPKFLFDISKIFPFFLIVHILLGSISEPRHFLPLALFMCPLTLGAIFSIKHNNKKKK